MEHRRSTVVILGANGRLGRAAVDAFAAAGWRVLAQIRRVPDAPFPAGVEPLMLALDQGAALARAAAGARVVIHAINPPYTDWADTVLPYGRIAMELAEGLGATLILPGNVYNFGRTMPAVLGPDTPQQADTARGRLRCRLEAEMAGRGQHGLRSVVIRAGDFFGSGRGNWFDQLIVKDLAQGRLVFPGPLDVMHAWAYLPDLAAAFLAVAQREWPAGLTDLPFAGHTLTGGQLLEAIEAVATAQGLRPRSGFRRSRLPWTLVRLVGLVRPLWRDLAEMSYLWRVPHRLDGTALAARVGPLPATPLPQALYATLRDLGLSATAAAAPTRHTPAGPAAAG